MANHRIPAGRAALFARAVRWLAAAPADVVEFPARHAGSSPEAPAGSLRDGLERWRRELVRDRLIVVVRRSLTVAAGVVAGLLLLRLTTGAPESWLVAALAVVAFAGAAAVALLAGGVGGGLTLARVARLLDRRLRLDERLGTAWELTTRGGGGPLALGVVAEGDRLVWELRARHRARPRRAAGEWTALAVALVAVCGLAAAGVLGTSDGGGDGGDVRAGVSSGRSGAAAAPNGSTTAATTPRTTPVPGATATVPHGASRATGAGAQRGAAVAAGSGATPPRISVRRRAAARDASAGAAGSSSGGGRGGSGSGAAGAARSGAGGSGAARRGAASDRAAAPGTVPAPNQVKGFSAQGRRASAPVAAGGGAQATQRADAAPRSGGRSGSRGAGRQASQLGGAGAQPSSGAGSERLPLRMLATSGGREQATAAGRAGSGGRGRGSARVQSGGAAGGSTAAGGTAAQPLPFVPTAVNAIAPYLRALVTTYFP